MADIVEVIKFDDSQAIKGLMNIDAQMDKLNAKIRQTEMSYEEAFVVAKDAMDDGAKVVDAATKSIGSHISETNKAKTASTGFKSALKDLADNINIMGVNLGGVVNQLKAKQQALKGVVQGVGAGTNAMKLFKVALASTGIGLLVVALGSLVAFFTKTEKGAEKLEVVFAGVGAVINVLTDRVAKFGEAVFKFFSGDLKGAAADAKAAFAGVGEELRKEVGLMTDLKKREQELEDLRRANRKEDVNNLKRIKELQLISDDNYKSAKEREAAAKEAGEIERRSQAEKNKLNQEDLDIEKAKFAIGAQTDADADKVLEKEEQAANSQIESLTLQRKLQSQLQGIQAEAAAKEKERLALVKELNDALEEQIETIAGALEKANLSRLSPGERILAESEAAKKEVDLLFEVLAQKAKAAGKEVDFAEDKKNLLLFIEEQKNKEFQKLRQEDLDNDRKFREGAAADREAFAKKEADKELKDIQDRIKASGEAAINSTSQIDSKFTDFMEGIKVKIGDIFGVETNEEIKEVLNSIGKSVSSIFGSMTAATEAAIEKNAELIESLQEQEEEAQESLEKEKERQAAGLANSVDAEEKKIAAIKEQQISAQKEAEQLRKKQLAAQLLADAISQGSNIVTMATNILASPGVSLLGPAGIPVALAVIAAFMSIFSKIKASQKEAKFYHGGSLESDTVTGFVNKSGRTDKHGGRGHRVEDSNLVLGGKEFVVNEQGSQLHADFLAHLNAGRFDDRDLIKELQNGYHNPAYLDRFTKNVDHRNEIISAHASRADKEFQVRAMDAVMGKYFNGMPSGKGNGFFYVIPKGGGTVVYVDEKGNKKIIESL